MIPRDLEDAQLIDAVSDLKALVRTVYPSAQFQLSPAPDESEEILLFATVDVDDLDKVSDLVRDRVLHYQLGEDIPIHVIPLHAPTSIETALRLAIGELRIVELVEEDGRRRSVEPHAIFWTPLETRCLHCYQVAGYTSTGGLPQWRNIRLDDIREILVTDQTFEARRDFNPTNEKIFERIEAQVVRAA